MLGLSRDTASSMAVSILCAAVPVKFILKLKYKNLRCSSKTVANEEP